MTLHHAVKVVFITEKMISGGVREILDDSGATGYTVVAAGGRGSRSQRSTAQRSGVVDDFALVRIEVIVADKAMAETIMDQVADQYFENYSGITYVEAVEVLRPGKFGS